MQWIVNAWFCREIVLPFLQQSEGRSIDKGCQIDSILTDTKNHFLLIFLIYEFFFRFVYGRVGSVCVFRKTNALALRNCQTRFLTTFDIHFWFQISQIGGKNIKGPFTFDWKIKRWGNCFENQKRRLDLKLKWNWPRKVEMEISLKWIQKGNISHWKVNEIRRGFSQRESMNWLEMKWSLKWTRGKIEFGCGPSASRKDQWLWR